MAVTASRKSVTTTPLLIATNPDADGARLIFYVENLDATNAVDLGPVGVNTGTGYSLKAGAVMEWELTPGESLYAVAASGTVILSVAGEG